MVTIALLSPVALAGKPAAPRDVEAEFGRDVQLAPFVVQGKQLPISIHARSKRDRKYAEKFADEVVKVVHDGVTEELGYGLVIVGTKGEPHPITVFRRFQEMARAGQLDPEVAAVTTDLDAFLEDWEDALDDHGEAKGGERNHEIEVDFETLLNALPLPLEGVGARLYQIAWTEEFDDERITERLRSMKLADLESDTLFARFDWVFYLPHRGAFDPVMKAFMEQAMREEEMGFVTRMAARTAMTIFKPIIRNMIEGIRKGMMLMTVVRSQTDYTDAEVFEIMGAYIHVSMPDSEVESRGSKHDTAVWAVRDAIERLGEEEGLGGSDA